MTIINDRGLLRERTHRLGAASSKPRCFRYSTRAASTSLATSVRQNTAPCSTQFRHSRLPFIVIAVGRGLSGVDFSLSFAIIPTSDFVSFVADEKPKLASFM